MAWLTDIEIAQQCKMKHIDEIAKLANVDEKYIEHYGRYKAKIDLSLLKETERPDGKLILVTAITKIIEKCICDFSADPKKQSGMIVSLFRMKRKCYV